MRATLTPEQLPLHPFAPSAERHSIEHDRYIGDSLRGSAIIATAAAEPVPGAAKRFARMIARRLPTVLIVTVLPVIAALVLLQFMTPLYTSSAQIMIQRITANEAPPSAEDRQRVLRNEQELIVSTPVLASALAAPGVHDISPLRGRPDALKLIKSQIHVDSGRSDDLVNISYDAADPREGTRLLAAVVEAYVRFRSGLHETSIDGSTATVQAEKQRAAEALKQKRTELQKFCEANGLALGNEQVDAADAVLHELGIKLAQAHVETVASRAEYDQMQRDLVNDPRLQDQLAHSKENDSSLAGGDEEGISKQICALQTQLAGYGTKFMANYAPVQLIHRRIDDLKLTRDSIIQQRWQAAVRSEAELETSFKQEQVGAAASEANAQAFDQHKAEVQEADKQVAMLDKQLKELESANKLITTMVTVIEPPAASDQPTKPRSALILIIAALAGLALGCGIAGIRDLRADTEPVGNIKTLGAGLPLLARLPAVPRRQLAMNSWRDRVVDSAAEFADACRKVQLALETVTSFSGGRTVLITSTNPREGKSTLASLLALTLAQTQKRVLLVDANLQSPVQGEIFDIEESAGLGQLLEEQLESSFASYVHAGTDPRMDILLSGSATAAVPDLLNSQRFTDLMAAMAAEYDYVLIDSPALSTGSDARIIASACDATIVLAGEASLNRKALGKTRDSLTSVGGNVIGVVLNGGMPAVSSQPALVNIDVSHHEPARPSIQVTTVRPSPSFQEVQSVVAQQVRREVEPEPEVVESRATESSNQWIWSYVLALARLVAGWMTVQGMWGSPLMPSRIVKTTANGRTVVSEPAVSVQQEPVSILMAGGGLLVITLIAGFATKPPRQEIGTMLLSAGLAIWSFHGGVINAVWRTQQHSVMVSATADAILLFASLAFGWAFIRRVSDRSPKPSTDGNSIGDIVLAAFATACAMSALMILLSHWQTKGECLAVIAFSSCLAAMMGYAIARVRSSLCFWLSPLTVALFGCIAAELNARGVHVGMLLALARPLPMDYAGMGPIGAMLGFWIARSAGRMVWAPQLAA